MDSVDPIVIRAIYCRKAIHGQFGFWSPMDLYETEI